MDGPLQIQLGYMYMVVHSCQSEKLNKSSAIEKNLQIEGLKILIFQLYYITMYIADIKFPNKQSVTT